MVLVQRMGAPLETKFREEIAAPGVAFEADGEHGGDAAVRGAMEQMLDQAAADASCRSAASATATATAARGARYRPRCASCRTRISPRWVCSRRGPASVSSAQPHKRARRAP